MNSKTCLMLVALTAMLTFTRAARATDYYVGGENASDGNDGSSGAPFATIDKAVSTAVAGDNIYVEAGEYATTTANGPDLKANLIGCGAAREDVVISAGSTARTLKMESGSMATNITFVGNKNNNVTQGGTIYMNGGTLVGCVVRDGKSTYSSARSGGNILMLDGVVDNCVISNGTAASRGGNIDMEGGTVRNCLISGGQATAWGGNVYVKGADAVVTNCTIIGGKNTDTSANNAWGGNVNVENAGTVVDCIIRDGTSLISGGNVFMSGGTLADCTISGGTALGTTWEYGGGNIYINGGAKISRCDVSGGNGGTGSATGGGIRCRSSAGVIEDCLVHENDSGICLDYGSAYNCTVVKNTGYGLHGYTGKYAKIQNCVVFGNGNVWTGEKSSTADAIVKIAVDDATSFGDEATSISASDFADYQNGNYRPGSGSVLIDAGASDPRGLDASQTDLDGNSRLSGTVDLGCYEYQKQSLVVHIDSISYDQSFAPAVATFTHSSDNSASPGNVSFTYDFGDGSESASTSELTISHAYTTPGVYSVTIFATNVCEEESAEMSYDGYVRVASSTIYVTPGNDAGGTFPYDTPEKGYGKLKNAVQSDTVLDGFTLLLGEGVHETGDQVYINKALTIRGLGATPEDVIVRNTTVSTNSYYFRVMDVANAGAFVENITLENGRVKNTYGGNLSLSAGVVSNCVIRGGLAVADSGNAAGGGVVLSGAGTLTHCVVTNNNVVGTSNYDGYAGGAVFIESGKKNGRISNCLIAHNTYVPSEGDAKAGAAGVRFGGSNDNVAIENCTIVANTVEGSLKDNSAGVYCTTWYGRLRNNIVVGNYETGKGKCTSVKLDFSSGNTFTYHNNITDDALIEDSGNKSKDNILVQNPSVLFKNFAAGDFTPKAGGAAYNKGTTSGLTLLPSVDLKGNTRVMFDMIDIGCYECQVRPGLAVIVR